MFALLHHYLINNSSIDLPGIGTLQFENVPSQFDITHRQIYPPNKKLLLLPNAEKGNKQSLIGFLSKHLDMPQDEAQIMFHHFLGWAKNTIDTKDVLHWENLGEFHKDENGTVLFVQSGDLAQYLQPVKVQENITRQHSNYSVLVGGDETTSLVMEEQLAEDKNLKKNYWWIWAITIVVVSAAIIALKFLG